MWRQSELFAVAARAAECGSLRVLRVLRRLPGWLHGGQVLHRPPARRARSRVRLRPRRGRAGGPRPARRARRSSATPRSTAHGIPIPVPTPVRFRTSATASARREVTSTVELGGATWPEIAATQRTRLLAVPLGSLEQHGPHLPLDTDTRIAVRAGRSGWLGHGPTWSWRPPCPTGRAASTPRFAGTLLVNHVVLADLLVELVRSARDAVRRRGRDLRPRRQPRCTRRWPRRVAGPTATTVLVWPAVVPSGDAHAGRTETSLMLAIDPAAVRVERAEPGCTEPLDVLLPRLRTEGVQAGIVQRRVGRSPRGKRCRR